MIPRIIRFSCHGIWLATITTYLHADEGTRSNPYTEDFSPRFSYYHHTKGDNDTLNAVGGNNVLGNSEAIFDALDSNYIKLTGNGRMVTGLVKGDFLEIKAHGRVRLDGAAASAFNAAAVFTDRAKIRKRNGYQNRFQDAALLLPVLSLRDSELRFPGAAGVWPGEANALQSTVIPQFRISHANGTYPGIIVKVPETPDPAHPDVYLFKSVNYSSFSKITNTDSKITLTRLDPAQRPRFTIALANRTFTEGQASAGVLVTRDTRTEFLSKVKYTLIQGTATGADITLPTVTTGTLVFNPGDTQPQPTGTIIFKKDNLHEGDETFQIRLEIDARDNPNEAYVDAFNQTSHTYSLTLKNSPDEPAPTPIISPASINSNEPASNATAVLPLPLTLNRASSQPINIGLEILSSGTAQQGAGKDYLIETSSWSFNAGSTNPSGSASIRLLGDSVLDGTKTIHYRLKVNSGPVTLPTSNSFAITINDFQSQPANRPRVFLELAPGSPPDAEESVTTRWLRLRLVAPATLSNGSLSSQATTVNLGYSGTAARNSDYTAPSQVLIGANTQHVDFSVSVSDDAIAEFDETISVSITSATTHGGALAAANGTTPLTLIVRDNDGGDLANTIEPTVSKPPGNASAVVVVTGFGTSAPSLGIWRIAGEPGWRLSGTAATGLAAGFHEIEFRPFDGYLSPPTRIIRVAAGGTWQLPAGDEIQYEDIDAPAPVGLKVNLLGATGGQWKLDGETAWRDSGSTQQNLPIGSHKIHFNPPPGFQRPAAITRRLNPANPVNEFNIQLIAMPIGTPPKTPLALADPATDALPHAFIGRISTSNGFATGTAVGPNSVLTAAHVLFDDRTLGYVTDVRYQNQAHRGYYQPSASEELEILGEISATGLVVNSRSSMKPRGWVMLSGYAERRTEDLDAGMGSGSSGLESQNLDVAVAYFGNEVARGGHVGVRVATLAGEWINAPGSKSLVGYPVTQVTEEDAGKMHASIAADNISFSQTYLRVFRSNDLVGGPGVSGGPLVIRGLVNTAATEWKLAAVYLGESVFGVYREIDEDVADIIKYAQVLSGDDSSGDGAAPAAGSTTRSTSVASLEVRSNLPGATWRNGSSPLIRLANQTIVLQNLDFEVQFAELEGWVAPGVIRGTGILGENTVVEGVYRARSYGTLAAAMAIHSPDATEEELGPMGDMNRNGTPNIIEWAFNLDPARPGVPMGLTPGTGTEGLPAVGVIGAGPVRRLKVEFIRMKPSFNPNLRYVPEFCSSLEGNAWTESGQIIAQAPVDDMWERVVVEDSVLNAPVRFARLRVEEIPADN